MTLRQDIYRTQKRSMPTLYAVAMHWITPLAQHEARAAGEAEGFRALAMDEGEPPCVRCGWRIPVVDERLNEDSSTDVRREWKAAGVFIDRAHLCNHAEDGGGECSNVVPLCHLCHRSMPWFTTRREALRWVAAGCDRPGVGWFGWQQFTDHVYGPPWHAVHPKLAERSGMPDSWGWTYPSDGRKELRDLYAHWCERVALLRETEQAA